jgi:hypothetical protein
LKDSPHQPRNNYKSTSGRCAGGKRDVTALPIASERGNLEMKAILQQASAAG